MDAQDRTPARVLAIAGLAGLAIVLIVIVALIAGAGGDDGDPEVAATPAPATTPEPTATAEPSPTPKPLTAEQKLERQDAVDVVRSRDFEVKRLRDYDPEATLRVLIGRSSTGSEFAFFFVDGQYLGNDSTEPSAKVRVKRSDDLEVTLSYSIFEPGDGDEPTGEPIIVRFRYAGGRVEPVEAIPAATQRAPR